MRKYEIILKNEKERTYSTISWLIISLNFVALLYLGISGLTEKKIYSFIGAGLLLIIFFWKLVWKKNNKTSNDQFNSAFTIAIIAWMVTSFYWVSVINFFLFLLHDITRRKMLVLFFEDRIVYPSFPKRAIFWNELSNVVLKDGILTIDFKNNKLWQQPIDETGKEISEKEFNEFCRLNLTKP